MRRVRRVGTALCDFINLLEEQSNVKCPQLSIDIKQSLIARIAQLEILIVRCVDGFVQVDAGYIRTPMT